MRDARNGNILYPVGPLDYADQRYYASSYGRFNTADGLASSAMASNPGSWNRYAYAGGDPVNRNDPSGMIPCAEWYYYMVSVGDYFDGADDDSMEGNCGPGLADMTYDFDPCSVTGNGFGYEYAAEVGLACTTVTVFADPPGASGPPIVNPQPQAPVPIYCEPDVIAAMGVAWQQTANGTDRTEAGFRIDGPPLPGMYTVIPNQFTNQVARQTLKITDATTSVFHVHPNGYDPAPSTGDRNLADLEGIDIFSFSRSGLYEYDPITKATMLLRKGLSWLKPCD
jgi:RHS repeat-associated protein